MQEHALSPDQYERDANRIRARLSSTWAQLGANLAPSNLATEIARASGVHEITPAGVFDFGARRRPVPTAVIGLGLGLLAFSLARTKSSNGHEAHGSLRKTAEALGRSATDVFRDRAEAKRQALISVASSQIRAGATQLSDAIEKGVDDVIGEIPATPGVRPFIQSAIQMALLAALEALLPNRDKRARSIACGPIANPQNFPTSR